MGAKGGPKPEYKGPHSLSRCVQGTPQSWCLTSLSCGSITHLCSSPQSLLGVSGHSTLCRIHHDSRWSKTFYPKIKSHNSTEPWPSLPPLQHPSPWAQGNQQEHHYQAKRKPQAHITAHCLPDSAKQTTEPKPLPGRHGVPSSTPGRNILSPAAGTGDFPHCTRLTIGPIPTAQ